MKYMMHHLLPAGSADKISIRKLSYTVNKNKRIVRKMKYYYFKKHLQKYNICVKIYYKLNTKGDDGTK